MKGMHWTKQFFRAFPFLLGHSPMRAGACTHSKFVKQILRTPNECAFIQLFWWCIRECMPLSNRLFFIIPACSSLLVLNSHLFFFYLGHVFPGGLEKFEDLFFSQQKIFFWTVHPSPAIRWRTLSLFPSAFCLNGQR